MACAEGVLSCGFGGERGFRLERGGVGGCGNDLRGPEVMLGEGRDGPVVDA